MVLIVIRTLIAFKDGKAGNPCAGQYQQIAEQPDMLKRGVDVFELCKDKR